jgi:hypothetical protein
VKYITILVNRLGEFLACWVIAYFGQFLIIHVAHIFGQLFPPLKLFINFDENGWATFWAIFFLQSQLVPLITMQLETDLPI